jgi:hypothetical protein
MLTDAPSEAPIRSGSARRTSLTLFAVLATLFFTVAISGSALGDPCVVNDPGGTVTLPPDGCPYLTGDEVHEITVGLPVGTTIELAPIHKDFICGDRIDAACSVPIIPGVSCEEPGGSLGGQEDCFESTLEFDVSGTGLLAAFSRTIILQASTVVVDTGARTSGDPVQSFPTEMVALNAQLFGDPDFCVLDIRVGNAHGLPPSTGHTTLTDLGGNNWNVDSFFDVTYEIDFEGCVGSLLAGYEGTTQGQLRMEAGQPIEQAPAVTGYGLGLALTIMAAGVYYKTRRLKTA